MVGDEHEAGQVNTLPLQLPHTNLSATLILITLRYPAAEDDEANTDG